jgi:shikimate dehydrogenase
MITGKTKIYAIIADPVAQVRTPEVFNALFERQQIDAVLVPVHVPKEGLEALINGFRMLKNLGGFIVTVPHKKAVATLCDEVGEAGQMVGAVNAVRREKDGRLIGNMFDGAGFVAGLKSQGYDPAGLRVLLLGAGGAGGAIALSLAEAGVASLTIANRTPDKAEGVMNRIVKLYPALTIRMGAPDPHGHDLIINATSLGMREEDPLPIDPRLLTPHMLVAEIIMKPEITPLLAAAKNQGCDVHYGRHMLDQQIQLMSNFIGATAFEGQTLE